MRWAYVYQNELGQRSANLKQTLHTVVQLSKRVEINFLCSSLTVQNRQFIEKQYGIHLGETPLPVGVELQTNNLLAELISRLQYNKEVVKVIQNQNFDVIYTRDFGFLFYLWITKQRNKIPGRIVYEPHKVYHRSSKKVMRFMEAGALKQCDALIPITNRLLQDLRSDFTLPQPALVVPDGVDIELHSHEVKLFESGPIKFIYAGSFKKWKGVETLIRSVKILSSEKSDIKVTICGGTDEEVKAMQKRCRDAGIEGYITLLGYLTENELQQAYGEHQAALLPNTKDTISALYTSPLKLFEYLASGLPIVASDLPSLREVLTEENAVFFNPEDPQSLAKAMKDLSSNDPLRKKMSAHNIIFAEQFTWKKRAENLVNFVDEKL